MSQPVPNPNGRPRLQFSFRALLACVTVLAVVFWISAPERLPRTIPVSGTITMDGAPVSGATVAFLPRHRECKQAYGYTDDKGNFTLSTYFNPKYSPDGALSGDYAVVVSKRDWQRINRRHDLTFEGVPASEIKHLLPEEYSSLESGLTATVKKGADNQFLFDLKADRAHPRRSPKLPSTSSKHQAPKS
ncbi:MAG: carboxypeptidase-like regulatory domain-containing protein [Pirellulales bacterium]